MSEIQKQKIDELAQKYHLKMVLLFGSQSNGQVHKESDIDIAYLSDKSLGFKQEYYLNFELTNIFKEDRVDTVDIKKASPLLMYAIYQHPQVLFEIDNKIFPRYQVYAFKKYVEARPLYEEKYRRLREQINMINP